MKSMKILDLGCGRNKSKQAVGVDLLADSDADIIADLSRVPYPFRENRFDLVICNHIIEHIQDTRAFWEEVYRVTKPGGLVCGVTPHFSNPCSYVDPDHKHHFSCHLFDFITEGNGRAPMGRIRGKLNDYLEFNVLGQGDSKMRARFALLNKRISFPKIFRKLGISSFANRCPRIWELYLSGIFRGRDIHFRLGVLKDGPARRIRAGRGEGR